MFYAIKHKPSGLYLPAARGRNGRGFTWVEPDLKPRLFARAQDAKCALAQWLKGQLTVRATSSDWEQPDIMDDEIWEYTPVPSRIPEDMAIVAMSLKEEGYV